MHLRCGGVFSDHFNANFLMNVPMKEFLKLSFDKVMTRNDGLFFEHIVYIFQQWHSKH